MDQDFTKSLIEEATILKNMLDRGEFNIHRLKALVAKVSSLGSPKQRKVKVNKYAYIR